jgi:hypothetical protein
VTKNNIDHENVNYVHARDRAAVVVNAVLAIVQDALNDPELRAHIASILRDEFADIVH